MNPNAHEFVPSLAADSCLTAEDDFYLSAHLDTHF